MKKIISTTCNLLIIIFLILSNQFILISFFDIAHAQVSPQIVRDSIKARLDNNKELIITLDISTSQDSIDTATINAVRQAETKDITDMNLLLAQRMFGGRVNGRYLKNARIFNVSKLNSSNENINNNGIKSFAGIFPIVYSDHNNIDRVIFVKTGDGKDFEIFSADRSTLFAADQAQKKIIEIDPQTKDGKELFDSARNLLKEKKYVVAEWLPVAELTLAGELYRIHNNLSNNDNFHPATTTTQSGTEKGNITDSASAKSYMESYFQLDVLKMETDVDQSKPENIPRFYLKSKSGGKNTWYYYKLKAILEHKDNGEYYIWAKSEIHEKMWVVININSGFTELLYIQDPVIGWADEYKVYGGSSTGKITMDPAFDSIVVSKIFNECDSALKCADKEFSKVINYPDTQKKFKSKFSGGPVPPPGAVAINSNGVNTNAWLNKWGVSYEATNTVAHPTNGSSGCNPGWIMKEVKVFGVSPVSGDAPAILSELGIQESSLNVFTKLAICIHVWVFDPIVINMTKIIEDAAGITKGFFRKHYA